MAFVVSARWYAQEGKADLIAEIIKKMTPLSRQEPGCLFYQAHRSPDNPNLFYLYEQYVDQSGYEAHMASPHFQQYVVGEAIPNLAKREREFFETM